jgi:ubiquinone/menaquinone biosynthesis C-methylase UbiE
MKKYIVESYENYKEEERLSTNNARKIEFLTTTRVMDELFEGKKKILDCAAGTGAYAFYLAEQGHEVTATDITPRHIEIIKENIKRKDYNMEARVLDAVNMEIFEDESFDVVLNMGPFYHLTEKQEREKCMEESIRVLKKGGIVGYSIYSKILCVSVYCYARCKVSGCSIGKADS